MGRFSRPQSRSATRRPTRLSAGCRPKPISSTRARCWNRRTPKPTCAACGKRTASTPPRPCTMRRDAFLKNEITAPQVEVKIDPADAEVLTETGGKPGSLSAAATEPADVPLDVQPAQPPGSLADGLAARRGRQLFDIGRDAQMMVAPMARGTTESMAMAKDFANAMRRNRWDWDRIDTDIRSGSRPNSAPACGMRWTRKAFRCGLGEPESAHARAPGLATLTPEERAAWSTSTPAATHGCARATSAWSRARAFPYARAAHGDQHRQCGRQGRRDGAGRDRPQSAHADAGHAPPEISWRSRRPRRRPRRNTANRPRCCARYPHRALATAQLEDAAAGRTLINNIKEYGKRTGEETVVEGAIPAGSETKWFTLDHPAFKTWRPKFGEVDGKVRRSRTPRATIV
jgi:hypothetical protein